MAAQKQGISVREIIADIRAHKAAPVYLLYGDEPYYIDLLVENFERYVVDDADKDFDYSMFYGNDSDPDYVIGAAQQFPLMSDQRLVVLKEAQSMPQAKNQLPKLAPYLSKPSSNTVFVIAFKGALEATSKLYKAAKEGGAVIFKSEQPKSWELPAKVKDYCMERKVSIEEKGVQLLCEYIGSPLSKLFGELNKLISIKGGQGTITCDDIERNIGISKDFNNFELLDALAAKNYPKAMQIVQYFEKNSKQNPTQMTTGAMITFFSNLIIAHYTPDKSDSGLMAALGYKSAYALKGVKLALRNYSAAQAVNAIHYLREFDSHSKGVGSLQNEYNLLKELIFKIFT